MKKVDNGLSSVSKEISSLEHLSDVNASDLSNIGLRGGAIQMMNQIANSLRHSSSATPTPSPSPQKQSVLDMSQPASTFSTHSTPTKDDLNSILDQFFNSASRYYLTSQKPRLPSEDAYSKLRKGIIMLVEEFFEFHETSRSKRNRDADNSASQALGD